MRKKLTSRKLNDKLKLLKLVLNNRMNNLNINNKNLLIAVILISSIAAGIIGYSQYKNKMNSDPKVSPLASNPPMASLSSTPKPTAIATPPPVVWETYTNSQLGFSIKYPQEVYGAYRCEPYQSIYVPLKTFEDNKNGIVYLAEEYYYDDWDNNKQSNTGPCKKITYSLESLNKAKELYGNPFLARVFNIKNIKNDSELNKFIKDTYGSGCFIESKNPWQQQKGVYEITIKGEDWDNGANLETTTCQLPMSVIKMLYKLETEKFMTVNLGQECGFGTDYYDQKTFKCYDEEMINSFRFE